MVAGVGQTLPDRAEDIHVHAGDKQPVRLGGQTLGDGDHLLPALPLTQNHFWEAAAKGPVVVHLREPDVLIGQATQPRQHLI